MGVLRVVHSSEQSVRVEGARPTFNVPEIILLRTTRLGSCYLEPFIDTTQLPGKTPTTLCLTGSRSTYAGVIPGEIR